MGACVIVRAVDMAFKDVMEVIAHVHCDVWIVFRDCFLDLSLRGAGDFTRGPMVIFPIVQNRTG